MPFVTEERWRRRSWRVACLDLVEGRAEAVVEAWGVELRKRLLHEVQAHGTIDGGLRFDLDAYSRLEWRHSETLAPFETEPGELAHLCEHGAHLTSLWLDRIPDLCEWRHELEVPAGTVFAHQPAATAQEIAEGCLRPAAVVGSYAVFAGEDGRKVAHIPRPVARDRDGLNPVWGTIRIRDGISTVSFDRAALLALRLPVTIYGLDTLGWTSAGGTWRTMGSWTTSSSLFFCVNASPEFDGTTTAITAYVKRNTYTPPPATIGVCYGLYSDIATPARLVDTGEIAAGGWPNNTGAWRPSNTDSGYSVLAALTYVLAVRGYSSDYDNGEWVYVASDAAGSDELWVNGSVAYVEGACPATLDKTPTNKYAGTHYLSVYCTYTPPAAGALPMAMHHYRRRHS